MFSLGDKNGSPTIRARSLPLVDRLNDLWRLEALPELTVDASSPRRAVIRAGDRDVLEVLPGDALDGDAAAEAHRLRELLANALRTRREAKR